MNCSPANLASQASCYKSCLSPGSIAAIKNYLLCAIVNVGGIGANLIPTGASYSGGGSYTLTISPNTTYAITWGANDTSATVGGTSYPSTGAGTQTTFYSSGNTTITFFGTGGSTVTAMLRLAPKNVPILTGLAVTLNGTGTALTVTWDSPPSQITSTNVYTSPDQITWTLAATVASPGTSSSVPPPAAGNVTYVRAYWTSGIATNTLNPLTVSYSNILGQSLVAYWKQDEGSVGATRVDATGNGRDLAGTFGGSGVGFTAGIISNGASYSAGQANCLNASGSGTFWANIQSGDSFSVSMWVKFRTLPSGTYNGLIAKWAGSGNWCYTLVFATTTTLQLYMENAANNGSATLNVLAPPSLNVWYHIVFGYDNATQRIWFQVNNGARQFASLVGVYNPATTQYFTIGRYNGDNGAVDCITDETGWWRRLLTTDEVAYLWNNGAARAYPL